MFDDIFDDALKGTEEGIIDIGKAGNDDWDTELPDVWSTGKPTELTPDVWSTGKPTELPPDVWSTGKTPDIWKV